MSVILSTISSAALAYFASLEKAKTQQAYDTVETLRDIPECYVSGLQTLIGSLPHHDIKKIVFLRGVVLPNSLLNNVTNRGEDQGSSPSHASDTVQGVPEPETSVNILESSKTHQQAVVVERSIIHGYNEKSNFLGIIDKKQEGKKVVSKERRQVIAILMIFICILYNAFKLAQFYFRLDNNSPLKGNLALVCEGIYQNISKKSNIRL
ncbi:uncharacterized protein LOC110683974 [Chenopodium quinoa]|uniref:uncharacterized protein LOC110683974 n=1 Tax=Chenopodium quinoa TaxID=63459 RepID=UPI000B76EA31|nr:uncharacterized protein LOC110683974 [Chenopodium quinoa]